MLLSILICHLKSRRKLLERLGVCLGPQIIGNADVEVLVESDQGEITTGEKRNRLLRRAIGSWVCMVDDDDLVSDDFVSRILEALKSTPDVVGMEGTLFRSGQLPRKFVHSIRYDKWEEDARKVFVRSPNHLNPVRREFALQTLYPNKTVGEDFDYSMRLKPLLKTEVMIDTGPIYFYHAG